MTNLQITGVKKTEERLCYDAHWDIYTNQGTISIKTYDGISNNEMFNKVSKCNSVEQILDLQPNCFYYD
jgi:hypothetical protein